MPVETTATDTPTAARTIRANVSETLVLEHQYTRAGVKSAHVRLQDYRSEDDSVGFTVVAKVFEPVDRESLSPPSEFSQLDDEDGVPAFTTNVATRRHALGAFTTLSSFVAGLLEIYSSTA